MAEIEVQSVIGVGHANLCHRAAHRMLNCSRIAALYDLGAGDREMVFDGDGYILRPLGYRLVYRNYCFLDRIEFCPREEDSCFSTYRCDYLAGEDSVDEDHSFVFPRQYILR
ncbi:hypothetical protein MRB53_001392 [Persea americana]|uniref:Uncharacterized protein n=1 Tax=Persea americana TaxID=3435 RepID=A0ACC2MRR7_PERAE|nr:hypothetical protein MRB53_001392 [Persea americana]